jgi:uncharacterized protein
MLDDPKANPNLSIAASEKPASSSPISAGERIQTLDILRGLALFGILVVNAQQMFQPFFFSDFSYADAPVGVTLNETGVFGHWVLIHTIFDTKFLTLFSLLFGIGFALQASRAQASGKPFTGTYLRRLGVLAVFGVAHATFFYPADVLVIYAITGGIFFMIARNLNPAILMQAGLILFSATILWGFAIESGSLPIMTMLVSLGALIGTALLGALFNIPIWSRGLIMSGVLITSLTVQIQALPDTGARDQLTAMQGHADQVARAFDNGQYLFDGIATDLPLDAETLRAVQNNEDIDSVQRNIIEQSIMRNGPPAEYFDRGLSALALFQFYGLIFLYWKTLALFAIGAALMKWGLLENGNRFGSLAMKAGLGVGLPLAALSTWLSYHSFSSGAAIYQAADPIHAVSALFIAVGLVGLTMVWVQSGRASFLAKSLAALGRAALTNYIGQSAVLAFITTWYGSGLAGTVSRWEQFGYCIVIFTALAVFSRVWLAFFEYGPLEWIWRTLTYAKPAQLMKKQRE